MSKSLICSELAQSIAFTRQFILQLKKAVYDVYSD
jgi:hypothetical protein